jgi:hypothetical protein
LKADNWSAALEMNLFLNYVHKILPFVSILSQLNLFLILTRCSNETRSHVLSCSAALKKHCSAVDLSGTKTWGLRWCSGSISSLGCYLRRRSFGRCTTEFPASFPIAHHAEYRVPFEQLCPARSLLLRLCERSLAHEFLISSCLSHALILHIIKGPQIMYVVRLSDEEFETYSKYCHICRRCGYCEIRCCTEWEWTMCLQACEESLHQKRESQRQRWKPTRTSGSNPTSPRPVK